MDLILQPWPWYVAGPLIALTMVLFLLFGKSFGVSSNLRTLCTIAGADKYSDFFKINWRDQVWNLLFVLGTVIGGYIAFNFLMESHQVNISAETFIALKSYGIANPSSEFLPSELFGKEAFSSFKMPALLLLGGFLVGFGARYAGGCTSGHAITGLSNLQIPSLLAVIGFFIGGLIATHFIIPYIF